jgi:hypothetical protein
MKKIFALIPVLLLTTGVSQASVLLESGNPPGSPLNMSAGVVSGPMFLSVVSNNPAADVMAAWNVTLSIAPEAGAVGTLAFQDPASAATSPAPANYVFGSEDLGITVTTSAGQLSANDFFVSSSAAGTTVPAAGANLLQMDFIASGNASGLFGIYAVEGAGSTQWTDDQFATRFFSNAPDGTSTVLVGEVFVGQVVPEPSALQLLGAGIAALAAWRTSRRWSH